MATYTAIASTEIDADSPITAALVGKIVDNPIASHKYVRRSSASAGNSTTTLADDGVIEFAAAASSTYAFKVMTYILGTAGVKVAIDFPASSTFSVLHQAMSEADNNTWAGGTLLATIIGSYFTVTDDDPILCYTGGSDYYGVVSEGIVTTTTAGTVKLRHASYSGGATTSTVQAGTFLTYHRVDAI